MARITEAAQTRHNCCSNPDYPCPKHRPISMIRGDTRAIDLMMRGNRPRNGIVSIGSPRWHWKPKGRLPS